MSKNMIKRVFLFFLFVPSYTSSLNTMDFIKFDSMTDKNSDCIIQTLDCKFSDSTNFYSDSVYVQVNESLSSSFLKVFDVFNTTSNSVYLYSGLFNSDWIRQPYVHQYNKQEKAYVLSLTPLYKNFKNVFQYNSILDVHYNWYRFVEIKPNQYYRLRTSISNDYLKAEKNAISSIDPKVAS